MYHCQKDIKVQDELKMNSTAMPLSAAPRNVALKVIRLAGGCEMGRRMAELGVLPGQVIRLCQGNAGGAQLVDVQGARMAIGQNVCRKIMVWPQ